MYWLASAKGYTCKPPQRRVRYTVFYKPRGARRGWTGVVEDEFTGPFRTVFLAIDAVEAAYNFQADRKLVMDRPPELRDLSDAAYAAHQERTRPVWQKLKPGYRAAGKPDWAVTLELPGNGPWLPEDIKAQFRLLLKKYRPDLGGQAEALQRVVEAYQLVRRTLNV